MIKYLFLTYIIPAIIMIGYEIRARVWARKHHKQIRAQLWPMIFRCLMPVWNLWAAMWMMLFDFNDLMEKIMNKMKKVIAEKEHVNHPKHYNSHPNGIECIDIIRHYTCDIANAIKYLWRAGLKPEMGMVNAEKEIEDLKKALWYIEDYRINRPESETFMVPYGGGFFKDVTGYEIDDVIAPYCEHITWAMTCLLCYLGIIWNGRVFNIDDTEYYINLAKEHILARIADLEH